MLEWLIPLGLAMIGAAVYTARLEGRITAHDQLFEEREKLAIERHQELKTQLLEIKQLLTAHQVAIS